MTTTARAQGRKAGAQDDGYCRDTIVLDFDGVISPDPGAPWRYDPAALDVGLIRECQAAGYAVAISTCGVVPQIAEALTAAGIRCWADHRMTRYSWHDGAVVLVTNRKIHGRVMLDDHGMHWRYGDDRSALWRRLEAERGYRWCPGPGRHHWGPDGAAGLLPWAIMDGKVYVALCERSAHVQGGRCWSTAGGAIEPGESAIDAALREAGEELTGLDHVKAGDPYVAECADGCGWSYTTYPAEVASSGGRLPAVKITSDGYHAWETISVRWFAADALPDDLHPGLRAAWPELAAQIAVRAAA